MSSATPRSANSDSGAGDEILDRLRDRHLLPGPPARRRGRRSHQRFQVGDAGDAVGKPGSPFVEDDAADRDSASSRYHAARPGSSHASSTFEMKPGTRIEIDRPLARHLVGDVDVAALRVPGFGDRSRCVELRSQVGGGRSTRRISPDVRPSARVPAPLQALADRLDAPRRRLTGRLDRADPDHGPGHQRGDQAARPRQAAALHRPHPGHRPGEGAVHGRPALHLRAPGARRSSSTCATRCTRTSCACRSASTTGTRPAS